MTALVLTTTTPAGAADRVDRMPQPLLERHAAWVASHGGVTGSCYGCATGYMKRLARELVDRAFAPYGTQRWAACIVGRESGWNPGAISRTDDHGLAQFNRPTWGRMFHFGRLRRDPAYAVRVFVRVSDGGRHTRPWDGGSYRC